LYLISFCLLYFSHQRDRKALILQKKKKTILTILSIFINECSIKDL